MSRNPHKNPNPQGKGLVPVLAEWSATRPTAVHAKAPASLLLDWFVSTLILSAEFRFRPVVGQRYYLYLGADAWQLSLIGPDEWGARAPGACLGACSLREDMTWDLTPSKSGLESPDVRRRLAEMAGDFTESLAVDAPLEELLPGYRRELPYYQRMLATGLGSSLTGSAQKIDAIGASAASLLEAAEGNLAPLLAAPGNPDAGPGVC